MDSTVFPSGRALRRLGAAAAIVLLGGCDRDQPTEQSGPRTQPTASQAAAPANVRPSEQAFADLAKSVHSSAGFYYDRSGALNIVVADSSDDSRAGTALDGLVTAQRVKLARGARIAIHRGRFSFATLAQTRDWLFDNVLGRVDGAISLDLDEVNNRVAVGLDPAASGARQQVLAQLRGAGLDTAVVRFRVHPKLRVASARAVTARSRTRMDMQSLTDSWSTIPGGVAIDIHWPTDASNVYRACSVGFVAMYSGYPGFVTASHCTQWEFGVDGTTAYSHFPGNLVAHEGLDPAGYQCGFTNYCRGSDASFFIFDNGYTANSLGLIARPMSGSTTIDPSNPYFIIVDATAANAWVGMPVQKIGWYTGWTSGSIDATCVDHYYGTEISHYVTRCVDEASYADHEGDSGGSVFQIIAGNQVRLLGAHLGEIGSESVFSQFDRISSDFGGGLSAIRPATLTAPTMTASIVLGQPKVTWTAVPGATTYYLFRTKQDPYCSGSAQLLSSTSFTEWTDASITNATATGLGQCPYASYYVVAGNTTEYSPRSNISYFQLSGGRIQ